MAVEALLWSEERLRTIILRYIQRHPELEGVAADKLIEAALKDEGHEPEEVLAAVEMLRSVKWLENKLREASKTRRPDPVLEIPGIVRVPVVKVGEDARGVPIYTNGARATIEQVVRQLEVDADEAEREAAQRRKEAVSGRQTLERLKVMGVDTDRTVYEDVPDAILRRLREEH